MGVQRWHDIVFDVNMTVSAVKDKLYRHGGTPSKHQELYLRRGGGDTIFLMDAGRTLGHYGARNGMEIHIKDTDEFSISKHGGLEDVSQVEKKSRNRQVQQMFTHGFGIHHAGMLRADRWILLPRTTSSESAGGRGLGSASREFTHGTVF